MQEAPIDETTPEALARRLDEAWETRKPVAPLNESAGLETIEEAYKVQSLWGQLRLERGERVVGRKIGLTSRAMREQFGVNEPDFGVLWGSRQFHVDEGRTEVPATTFLQPRLEGEIAFLIGEPLAGGAVKPEEVLAATAALAVAVEVVDSRIEDWRIKIVDTIADNASYGGFAVGPWSEGLLREDLRTLGMLIQRNGEPVEMAIGAAALGHPAEAVAWLANKLSVFDVSLQPGDVVLSGSLGGAVPVRQGDEFVVQAHGQPPLKMSFV